MSHLSSDRLAALADEQPNADEQLHLTQCTTCAKELHAHRALLAMAGTERESMQLPLTRWDALSSQLRTEGLIAAGPALSLGRKGMLQVAAAILLIAGGAVLGRFSAGASAIPGGITGTVPV